MEPVPKPIAADPLRHHKRLGALYLLCWAGWAAVLLPGSTLDPFQTVLGAAFVAIPTVFVAIGLLILVGVSLR
jgi:hypothetical protein